MILTKLHISILKGVIVQEFISFDRHGYSRPNQNNLLVGNHSGRYLGVSLFRDGRLWPSVRSAGINIWTDRRTGLRRNVDSFI